MNRRGAEAQSIFRSLKSIWSFSKFLCASASLRFTLFALVLSACSIPNLEPPECSASRQTVREFYSFHFGNDMNFSQENLEKRKEFLTLEFTASLETKEAADDVFTTGSTDFPKAFRVGECTVASPEKTIFQVVLFWRDDTRSEQKEIKVEALKRENGWLINRVEQF